jgi:hypothetical protein
MLAPEEIALSQGETAGSAIALGDVPSSVPVKDEVVDDNGTENGAKKRSAFEALSAGSKATVGGTKSSKSAKKAEELDAAVREGDAAMQVVMSHWSI